MQMREMCVNFLTTITRGVLSRILRVTCFHCLKEEYFLSIVAHTNETRYYIDDVEKNGHKVYRKICQNIDRKRWNVRRDTTIRNSLQLL